jgi:hypothetical protein
MSEDVQPYRAKSGITAQEAVDLDRIFGELGYLAAEGRKALRAARQGSVDAAATLRRLDPQISAKIESIRKILG